MRYVVANYANGGVVLMALHGGKALGVLATPLPRRHDFNLEFNHPATGGGAGDTRHITAALAGTGTCRREVCNNAPTGTGSQSCNGKTTFCFAVSLELRSSQQPPRRVPAELPTAR